ncbi:7131_t:CDS:1 [Funneliformis geosporum]|nr:7131_t:CDS:1 [Funneliformis geosporum]
MNNQVEMISFEMIKQRAEYCDCKISQYILGGLYEKGEGTEVNYEKAFYWYEISANNDYEYAFIITGYLCEHGIGTKVNLGKAFYWYVRSAQVGSSIGQDNVGRFYENGQGVEKDLYKAFYWYLLAAMNNYHYAQYNLGRLYEKGEGTIKDLTKAKTWYLATEKSGHLLAQHKVAQFFENISLKLSEKNLENAFYWYQLAVGNKNPFAIYKLGEYYEFGYVIEKDEVKAFEYYKESANLGYINAKLMLGYCYVNGIGTEINKEKGLELYDVMIDDLDEVNYWFARAAGDDNKEALYKLGEFYEMGYDEVSRSVVRALEFYKKSANQGFINAQIKVEYYYDHGIFVDVDKARQ